MTSTVKISCTPLFKPIVGHTCPISHVIFSPDGTRIVSASADGTVRMWCATSGAPLASANPDLSCVRCLAWGTGDHSNRGILAAGFDLDGIVLFDGTTLSTVACIPITKPGVGSLAWSPDGTRIATCSLVRDVLIWDVESRSCVQELKGAAVCPNRVSWSPTGAHIAATSAEGCVFLWDAETGKQAARLDTFCDAVEALCWSPDGAQIAATTSGLGLLVWEVKTMSRLSKTILAHGAGQAVEWSPDGRFIALCTSKGFVEVRAADETSEVLFHDEAHTQDATTVAWSPSSQQLCTSSWDKAIILWEVKRAV